MAPILSLAIVEFGCAAPTPEDHAGVPYEARVKAQGPTGMDGGGIDSSSSSDSPTLGPVQAQTTTNAGVKLEPSTGRKEWRESMSKTALPKHGCFESSYPSSKWKETSCAKSPSIPFLPYPMPAFSLVGSQVYSGNITRAEASFPIVVGVTSATPDSYSIQVNSNPFPLLPNSYPFGSTTYCSGASTPSVCKGWQQFVYSGTTLHVQYWLLEYNSNDQHPCPQGWFTGSAACWRDSVYGIQVPHIPIVDLADLVLAGQTDGVTDTIFLSIGNGSLFAVSQDSVLGLSNGWTVAEANVMGLGNGEALYFNSGVSIVVQTLLDSTSHTSSAPSVMPTDYSSERNNLQFVAGSYCQFGGPQPGMQVLQSNVPGTQAPACPLPSSQLQKPVAVQANTHHLWLDLNGYGYDTQYGMMPGTIPSLVTLQNGGFGLAFQANIGSLWIDKNWIGNNTQVSMNAGTSPSMTVLWNGATAVAFQANAGYLWLYK